MPSIDPQLKTTIHAALVDTEGNVSQAAGLLGMEYVQLKQTIHDCEDLRLRWSPGAEIGAVSASEALQEDRVNRQVAKEAAAGVVVNVPGSEGMEEVSRVLAGDEEVALAAKREDRRLRNGLTAMGLDAEEVEMATAMQAFQNEQFKSSVHINGAGMVRAGIKLQIELDAVVKRLQFVRAKLKAIGEVADLRAPWLVEEAQLMKAFVAVADQTRKNAEVAEKAALTMALIRTRLNGQGTKRARPGFDRVIEVKPGNGNSEPQL